MKYKNIFFEEIGYPSKESVSACVFGTETDSRVKDWTKQRKKWGNFDSRVGWNLNQFVVESMYTWLCIFLKKADKYINLEYYKFEIDGVSLTQKECIERMIKDLEYVLTHSEDTDFDKSKQKLKDCFNIFSECFPAMWY